MASAELPPRKNPTPTKILTQSLSPLETLLQMGFSKTRAEKALVATGGKGPQLAADWLLAHVKDPNIDNTEPRDFIIYLCPVGELKEQLSLFWQKSRLKIGWNGAHNSFPHITLTSSFKCPDQEAANLLQVISQVCGELEGELSQTKLGLERYISPNFFGLFVRKEEEEVLTNLATRLCEGIAKLGFSAAEPILKSFHLTLAYQFQQKHFTGLEELAEAISPEAGCGWQLRLYSYDSLTDGAEVYKVLYAHVPREPDELELVIGDFIFVTQEEMANTTDGWVVGISWLTGSTGYLPNNYVERTAETNAWTLHTLLPLIPGSSSSSHNSSNSSSSHNNSNSSCHNNSNSSCHNNSSSHNNSNISSCSVERLVVAQEECDSGTDSQPHRQGRRSTGGRESPAGTCDSDCECVSSSVTTPTGGGCYPAPAARQLFVVRHGERVDFTFGLWIPYSFTKEGKYVKKDLNMPGRVPERKMGPEGFTRDCPLTVIGTLQAKLVGEAMREANVSIHHVFCSPSLRCVQTCHGILSALGVADKIKINLEPGLFEWLAWYQDGMPDWMTGEELRLAGYNIECSYKPYISADELQDAQESCQQFYIRNFFVTQCALQATEDVGGNVLLVGHAATLETCSRQLVGKDPRPVNELMSIVRKVPYCCVGVVEEILPEDEDLSLGLESPLPSSRHGGSSSGGGGGRTSPGGISSASLLSRSTLRSALAVPPPPPREWRIVPPPFPPLTHTSVSTFDWKILLDRTENK